MQTAPQTCTWILNLDHPDTHQWIADQFPDDDPTVLATLMAPLVVEQHGRYLIRRFQFADHFGSAQPRWIDKRTDLPAPVDEPDAAIRPSQPLRPPTIVPGAAVPTAVAPVDYATLYGGNQ